MRYTSFRPSGGWATILFFFGATLLQEFHAQSLVLKAEGQALSRTQDLVQPGQAYFIKNKATQKVLEVKNGSNVIGADVLQSVLNGKISQKFTFENSGEAGFFFIRTLTGGHHLTLAVAPNSTSLVPATKLIQDAPYTGTTGNKIPDAQKWKITLGNEIGTVLISNKLSGDFTLRAGSQGNNSVGAFVKDGSDAEKWVLKITTTEDNPNSNDADKGLVVECVAKVDAMFLGLNWETTEVPIGAVLPEWRGVGENGAQKPPLSVHRVLEGTVNKNKDIKVNFEDLPMAHFTHDFIFHINPDPPFQYLLGIQNGAMQDDIEVEWESGLGQNAYFNPIAKISDKVEPSNPAVAPNIVGNSFGFFSEGHKRKQVIWNWPTHNDWVHVEGQWIWDRGHPPAKTEIHPPRLVAIKRNLPDKFDLGLGKFVFATRCDVFANGDGNVIWNNKGIHPFASKVEMSDRDYVIVFRHDLPRPGPAAKLKAVWKDQPGNTFTIKPAPVVNENGTADVPQPHVVVTIPWQTSRVSDKAVFARTLFIYWDDATKHGVPDNFKIKEVEVRINKIVILDKSEGGDPATGEHRIFADAGGQWVFLNEFVGVDDNILTKGLGRTWDTKYSKEHFAPGSAAPFPIPEGARSEFIFNQNFHVYVPEGKEFRVHLSGWEADYVNRHFGRIINPYISCTDGKKFVEDKVDGKEMLDGGCLDDPIGNITEFFEYDKLISKGVGNTAINNPNEEPGDCPDATPKARYEAHFQVLSKKIGEKGASFKVTLQKIRCTGANDNNDPKESEEPYGKLAVYLSSPKHNNVKDVALGAEFAGVIPEGFSGNFLFNHNDDKNLSLKSGQEFEVKNAFRVYTFSASEDPNAVFIAWGDMKEDDGDDEHDKLNSELVKIKLSEVVLKKKVQFIQKIGANKTQFEAHYTIEHIQE